ncbi:MAG: hypothetical protein SXG53_18120 [Pseudomonadota bacterium]|nr:hypothetical protein [Pseudomonadota bacterium]
MATDNDTSKPRRSRRKQPNALAQGSGAAPLDAAAATAAVPSPTTPATLEEAIENVRTLLFQVRGVLHCLADVLLYSDDNDGVMHADVAQAAEHWIDEAAKELEIAKLQSLIDAIRERGSDDAYAESESSNKKLLQVKEPTPVYLAA